MPSSTSICWPARATPRLLDQVFQGIRDEVNCRSGEEEADEQYVLAQTYREMGMIEDAVRSLEHASRSPRRRFDAAAMLGRIYFEHRDFSQAVEWLERAAEAPPSAPDAGPAQFCNPASALESAGEESRALGGFLELQSQLPGYRDVAERVDRLSKTRTRG